jgi:hypothetical protein
MSESQQRNIPSCNISLTGIQYRPKHKAKMTLNHQVDRYRSPGRLTSALQKEECNTEQLAIH